MTLLLEEILVEFVAIAATLVAAGILLTILVGFALERRELRRLAETRRRQGAAPHAAHAGRPRPWPSGAPAGPRTAPSAAHRAAGASPP